MGNSPSLLSLVPEACRVFTPEPLAEAMVAALATPKRATWLEPSVGDGVFINALAKAGVGRDAVVAIDIDPACAAPDLNAAIYRDCDALAWMRASHGKFSRVLGNPPYASLSNVRGDVLSAALDTRLLNTGKTVGLNSNLWVAFVCAAVGVLQRKGSMAFVLPAAWDYATYAGDLRKHLPHLFRSFCVVRSARPLFPGIQDGCVVIVGKGYKEPHNRFLRLECDGIEEVCTALRGLSRNESASSAVSEEVDELTVDARPLSAFAEVRIGAVTGDSRYFILNEAQRAEFKLPLSSLVPVLSKARHLLGGTMGRSDFELLREANEPVWLFKPGVVALRSMAVQSYLARRETMSIKRRTKVRGRKIWHSPILPPKIHAFMSGMTLEGPLLCLRNMHNLSATNTLYVVTFKEFAARFELALGLLGSNVWTQVQAIRRRYPDGLLKLEPGELASLRVIPVRIRGSDACYAEAAAAVRAGDGSGVRAEIDVLLRKQQRKSIR